MRLAFCFMSNNIHNLYALIKNFKYDMAAPPYIIDSYTKNILLNPPIFANELLSTWNCKWKTYESFNAIDYFSIRQDSLDMAGHAKFIFVGDDDFKFNDGASKVINECCKYMEIHKDCGAILLGANFGEEGSKHGNEIYITNNGHLNTNRGIILRNRINLMDNRLHALGAMEDSVISFTCLRMGYYIARRLHVPIDHIVERNSIMLNHNNINYDKEYIMRQGIWYKVHTQLGGWYEQDKWPKGVFQEYHQSAMINGFTPKYDVNGGII
jgi:hypothetical protein